MTTDPQHGELNTREVAVRVAEERGLELLGLAGEGVDFAVYRARCATHGEVALRIPRHRVYSAPYGQVDAGDLVRQEHEIAGLLTRQGLPAATAIELITTADALVVSLAGYVQHDGLPVLPRRAADDPPCDPARLRPRPARAARPRRDPRRARSRAGRAAPAAPGRPSTEPAGQ